MPISLAISKKCQPYARSALLCLSALCAIGCNFDDAVSSGELGCGTAEAPCPEGYVCEEDPDGIAFCFKQASCEADERRCNDGQCVTDEHCCEDTECTTDEAGLEPYCNEDHVCEQVCADGYHRCGTQCVQAAFVVATRDSCDPVSQCGCPEAQTCQQDKRLLDKGPLCQQAGAAEHGARCSAHTDCAPDLGCFYNTCLPYCHTANPATCAGQCVSEVDALGVCHDSCNPNEETECPDGRVCAQLPTGEGVCIYADPPFECSHQGGSCSGPSGSRLCARDEDDAEACCRHLSVRHGNTFQCDPISQCGCGPGEHCRMAKGTEGPYAACAVPGLTPYGEICSRNDDCTAGSNCYEHVCTPFCVPNLPNNGCSGTCVATTPSATVGACFRACNVDDPSGCPDIGNCVLHNSQTGDGRCSPAWVAGACPSGTDMQCDGPQPEGTGRCQRASDDPDCALAPSALQTVNPFISTSDP